MSRLNLDHVSGFVSIELVMAAAGPPGREGGSTRSFEHHLEQARQTVDKTIAADRPPTPRPRPEAHDRKADQPGRPAAESGEEAPRQIGSGTTEDDQPTTTETRPDSDPRTGVSETASDADQETGVSDAEGTSGEEDENDDDAFAADSAQVLDAANIDVFPFATPTKQEGIPREGPAPEENDVVREGQGQSVKPVQEKQSSTPTSGLPPGELEEADRPDAKIPSAESPASGPEANGGETASAQGKKGTTDQVARQSEKPTEAEHQPGAAPSNTLQSPGAESLETSSQSQGSTADSRRQGGRPGESGPVADRPNDGPLAEHAPNVEPVSTTEKPLVDSPTDLAHETKAPPADATANSTPADRSETTVPTQAWLTQGSRQTSPARDPGASDPAQVDRVRFVQRVARAFEAVGARDGSIRLRLHPPELGSLRLEVTIRNGTMIARMEVEDSTARSMLLDNLPALRNRLAQQDIKVGRFDVDLADQSPGGSPERPGGHPQWREQPDQGSPSTGSEQEIEAERPPRPRPLVQPGHGTQLDVVI